MSVGNRIGDVELLGRRGGSGNEPLMPSIFCGEVPPEPADLGTRALVQKRAYACAAAHRRVAAVLAERPTCRLSSVWQGGDISARGRNWSLGEARNTHRMAKPAILTELASPLDHSAAEGLRDILGQIRR